MSLCNLCSLFSVHAKWISATALPRHIYLEGGVSNESVTIEMVGGPAHGKKIPRPFAPTVIVPIMNSKRAIIEFKYTLRRCRTREGLLVEVLAPAGQNVDERWLKARGWTN